MKKILLAILFVAIALLSLVNVSAENEPIYRIEPAAMTFVSANHPDIAFEKSNNMVIIIGVKYTVYKEIVHIGKESRIVSTIVNTTVLILYPGAGVNHVEKHFSLGIKCYIHNGCARETTADTAEL